MKKYIYISEKIPKKPVLLAACGGKEGIWEAQGWESYFLLLFFIWFFTMCMHDIKNNIKILLKVHFESVDVFHMYHFWNSTQKKYSEK